jgi:protein-arginine kinase activator protein McsA
LQNPDSEHRVPDFYGKISDGNCFEVGRVLDHVDLRRTPDHIHDMPFDISHLLEHWEYRPGQVVVRKFKGRDGSEKIQLRVDLGLLQMNVEGRPDGKRPLGYESIYHFYRAKLQRQLEERDGGEGFRLSAEDCAKLQLESLQYHHRYICLLQLADYEGVIRDAEHNLGVFAFVQKYAESDDLAWSLQQFQPQLLMILTRARALQEMDSGGYPKAIEQVKQGIEQIREFYREHSRTEMLEQNGEVSSLERWLTEISANRPISPRERLEQELSEAVQREDYEKAAQMRDALRNLKSDS